MKLLRMICGWLTKPSDLYMNKSGEYFTMYSEPENGIFIWSAYRQDWAGQWQNNNNWVYVTEHDQRKYAVKV